MRAVICTAYGPPEVLKLAEIDKPVPKKNEVLIKIKTTSVTASDCIVRGFKISKWHPIGFIMGLVIGFKRPRNPVLGMVLAGEIETVGKDVKLYKPGDQVVGWTIKSAFKTMLGTYAEYKCLDENSIMAIKPANADFKEAVAIIYGGLLAAHFIRKANLQKQQKVLIYGASGSIGTAALQLAKYFGTTVTGVCSTKNLKLVKSLGADKVVDYTKEKVSEINDSFDFIFDGVGKKKGSEFKSEIKNLLSPNGKYFSVDDSAPNATHENLNLLMELLSNGQFKPVIDRTYPLEEIVEAHRYVDQGHKTGDVVITI
ncbi:MAG: NAD(P)-dependent alcohol dehydrogenase [Prolixibacteraceae bacterium]|nr:NAD(P)-dependent alcohol dehydrogenase [Prolixibacteraceae bacterium]MBN2773978.1 NAD(P)-dependent alcohol dehydrogenase [Prolixibacteraceae bacterium]